MLQAVILLRTPNEEERGRSTKRMGKEFARRTVGWKNAVEGNKPSKKKKKKSSREGEIPMGPKPQVTTTTPATKEKAHLSNSVVKNACSWAGKKKSGHGTKNTKQVG